MSDLVCERRVVQRSVGVHAEECAFELAHIVVDVAGDEREDLVGNPVEVLGLGLLAEDGQAGLELRDLDVRDQAPLEAAAQAVLEGGDGFRGTVGRDDDLAVLVVELVERMEELLLELLGPLEELMKVSVDT